MSEDNGAPKKTIVFANTKVGRAQRDAVSLPEGDGKSLGNCTGYTGYINKNRNALQL